MSRVLLYTRTTDYRHDSIPHAARVVTALLAADGHETVHTEAPGAHRRDDLAGYAVVVWLSTSGDVLDDDERRDLAAWLADGGAWAGIHSATFAEPGWPELERIAGARFTDHPELQPGLVRVADPDHPSTAGLPSAWTHADEWYNFARPPVGSVLLTVDESSYAGGTMGDPHPVAWHGTYGRGRTWYTSLGHEAEAYDTPELRAHLLGGLRSLLA